MAIQFRRSALCAGIAALFGFLSGGLRLLGEAVNYWLPVGNVALRFATGFSPALVAAGYLMGLAAGLAMLLGVAFLSEAWPRGQALAGAALVVSGIVLFAWIVARDARRATQRPRCGSAAVRSRKLKPSAAGAGVSGQRTCASQSSRL